MRLRLGLLRDTAAVEKEAAKEAAEAQAKKHKHQIPTVKTEAQMNADEATAAAREKDKSAAKPKPAPKPRIRPLSEAKAIDSGATFISEAFLFLVGGGLIFFESWRSRRKESSRREDIADRLGELEESEKAARRALVELEREILQLRAKEEKDPSKHPKRILPAEVWQLEEKEEVEVEKRSRSWLSRIAAFLQGNEKDSVNGSDTRASSSDNISSAKPIPSNPLTSPQRPAGPTADDPGPKGPKANNSGSSVPLGSSQSLE